MYTAGRYIRLVWLTAACVALGTVFWASHFVALMGLRTRFVLWYSATAAGGALLAAVGLSAAALILSRLPWRWGGPLPAGLLLTAALLVPHYTDSQGLLKAEVSGHSWLYGGYSVALALVLAATALWLLVRWPEAGWPVRAARAALLGGAVVGQHYLDLAGTSIVSLSATAPASEATRALTLGAAGLSLVLLIILGYELLTWLYRAEREEARRRLDRFRLLVQYSSDIFTILHPDGTVLYQSDSTESMLGYRPQERIGKNIFESPITHPDDLEAKRRMLDEAVRHPDTDIAARFRLRHADGSWHYIEAVARNLLHVPNINGVVATYRDVTDRQMAENELRRQLDFTRALTAGLGEGLCALNRDGRITFVNPMAQKLLGWSEEEMLGASLHDFVHPDHPGTPETCESYRTLVEAANEGATFSAEAEFHRKDGGTFPVAYTSAPIVLQGYTAGLVLAFRDITEQRAAQAVLVERNRLSTFNAQLSTMLAQSEHSAKLLDGVAHTLMDAFDLCAVRTCKLDASGRIEADCWAVSGGADQSKLQELSALFLGPSRTTPEAEVVRVSREAVSGPERELLDELGLTAAAAFPLRVNASAAGRITVFSTQPISSDLRASLEEVASRVANAIARLDTEANLRVRAHQQAALAQFGQKVLTSPDIDTLMNTAVRLVADTLDVEYCKVLEITDDGKHLLIRWGTGWKPGYVGQTVIDRGPQAQAGYTLLAGEPVIVADLRTETRFVGMPVLHEHGIVSGITVEIPGSHGPYGVLGAHTSRMRLFSEDDAHFMQAVASLVGTERVRKTSEQELRQSQENLALAQQIAHLGSWDWNLVTGREQWSDEVYRIFGYTPGEITPSYDTFIEAVHPDDRESVRLAVTRALTDGVPYSVEHRIILRDGSERVVHERGEVQYDADRRPVRMFGTVYDVTERKQAEQQRTELLAQVERALELRNQFLSIASHELKTPITLLKGYSQVLAARAEAAGQPGLQKPVEVILRQADRMTTLVNDLLDISRIESGRMQFDFATFDLAASIREVVGEVQISAPEFHFRVTQPESPLLVYADRSRLQQVITNLLTNAVKYSMDRREAAVDIQRDGAQAVVSVTDYGIGIPEEQQSQVFELYFRGANASTSNYGGLGLGLYISRTIVERHGGRIGLESQQGEGSRFWFSIPLADSPD